MSNQIKKPIDTVSLALELVGMVKTASLVFVLTLLEWARRSKILAENEAAIADVNLKVEKANNETEKIAAKLGPADTIRNFLNR